MANRSVTFYCNTGFDTINIPDSASTLAESAHGTFVVDSIDIIDNTMTVPYIRVRLREGAKIMLQAADYCKVGNFYYSIPEGGIKFDANDVATIQLEPDFFLSLGGLYDSGVLSDWDILAGFTERLSGVINDDGTDPFIQAREPLEMETYWYDPQSETSDSSETTYIETTLDLYAMGDESEEQEATVYKYDGGTSEDSYAVTVPQPKYAKDATQYHIYSMDSGHILSTAYTAGTVVYILDEENPDPQLERGINRARGLNVDGAIINKVSIPNVFVGWTKKAGTPEVTDLSGKVSKKQVSIFSKDYASGIVNTEIMHTKLSSYNIMTGTGDSVSVDPLMIKTTEAASIFWRADPHLTGKVYYGFYQYMQASVTDQDTWRNTISGFSWKQVPLIFNQAAGNVLNRMQYDLSRETIMSQAQSINQMYGLNVRQAGENYVVSQTANTISGLSSALSLNLGGAGSAIGGLIGEEIDYGHELEQLVTQRQISERTMAQQRKAEALSFGLQNYSTVVPQVNFPYNSEPIRDFLGNGVFCYRYKMTTRDLTRNDTIITAYGHSVSKVLEKADFHRCKNFDYVQANVEITGDASKGAPKWLCKGLERQLSGGVRIWHRPPLKGIITSRDNPLI